MSDNNIAAHMRSVVVPTIPLHFVTLAIGNKARTTLVLETYPGSAATRLRCGGTIYDDSVVYSLTNLPVNKF